MANVHAGRGEFAGYAPHPNDRRHSNADELHRDHEGSPFFLLDLDQLSDNIARLGTERSFARGEYLYRQGEFATALHSPVKGRIRVFMTGIDGMDRNLTFAGPHTTIGEYGIFDDGPRYTSAVAAEDSRVLVIDRETIMSAGRTDPDILIDLARRLAQRARLVCMHVMYGGLPAHVRVATLFLQLLNAYGTPLPDKTVRLSTSYRVEDLAHLIGVTRVTMSRELARFIEDGILTKVGRDIVISNVAALQELANASGLVPQLATKTRDRHLRKSVDTTPSTS